MRAVSASWNNPQTTSSVVALRANRVRAVVAHPVGEWWDAVVSKIGELTALERGWDGYGAGPVNFETAHFALNMLQSLCVDLEPQPQIVPGANGDLQIEWHEQSSSVELHVVSPNHVRAWRRRNSDQAEEELVLKSDFSSLLPWMLELARPAVAVVAAAN